MMGKADDHLEWLELERSKRTFNIGDFNVKATPDSIIIKGKTSESWGRDLEMDRSRARIQISTESRTPMFIFYLVYVAYAVGFLMFFITSGVTLTTQVSIFALALFLMFTPLVFDSLLSTRQFLILTAVFYVAIFSAAGYEPLQTAFKAVEQSAGKGYVETFIIFASIFPLILRRMIAQMMISYRLKLEEGSSKFEVLTESPGAVELVNYLREGPAKRSFYRFPSFFFKLSRKRMKPCFYCDSPTLTECKRCNRPICADHTGMLKGYKVCLDCFVERRGKTRRNLR